MADTAFFSYTGTYIRNEGNSGATILIQVVNDNKIKVKGSAYWGKNGKKGPNVGEINFTSEIRNEAVIFKDEIDGKKVEIHIILHNNSLKIKELYFPFPFSYFGLNVSFAGEYYKT